MAVEYPPTCASCVKPVESDAMYYDARLWHKPCLDERKPAMKAQRKRGQRLMESLGMIRDDDRSERRAR